MHRSDIARIAEQSRDKAAYLDHTPVGYLILSALAGVYLGFGITLIFSVEAPFAAEGAAAQKLVMGAAFGVALALVIFAGSELFTGNNMICVIGALTRVISWGGAGADLCRLAAQQPDNGVDVARTPSCACRARSGQDRASLALHADRLQFIRARALERVGQVMEKKEVVTQLLPAKEASGKPDVSWLRP